VPVHSELRKEALMFTDKAVLVVWATPKLREGLAAEIARCGLRPVFCDTLHDARKLLTCCEFDLVLCEDVLPDGASDALLKETSRLKGALPVVVVSRLGDWDAYLSALGAGAFDYVAWPGTPGELDRIVRSALKETPENEKLAYAAA
jgi:DNA-binding NtrC family response regulator